LDWINAERILKLTHGEPNEDINKIPTQVLLCELLRFLEHALKANNPGALPRVAVLVTAWDRLDKVRAALLQISSNCADAKDAHVRQLEEHPGDRDGGRQRTLV